MFIIDITYTRPLDDVDSYMDAHVAYLNKFYQADVFLMWGRKVPRTGGIIIGQADSLEIMEKIAAEDPFIVNEVATSVITNFKVSKGKPAILDLIR